MGLNDTAWEKLFDRYRILDEVQQKGAFIISASQIRAFREPRLMTKFDHRTNRPRLFGDHNLSILPITRGDYIISSFSAYQELTAPAQNVQKISIPAHLQSLMPQFLVSEAIALNCASACGILHDFLGEEELLPTVHGRMGSGCFDFDIHTDWGRKTISVKQAQIEIDATYEGIHSLALFEAKRNLCHDFLIRQLYYPFRLWSQRVNKPIKPVFFVFSNGTFHLYQYQFTDPQHYNSLTLVKQKSYALATEIVRADMEQLLRTVPLNPEPSIPFPQANRMDRMINLMELLHEKPMTKQEITSRYAFDERQTNYYSDAGRYLGLMEKKEGHLLIQLSDCGHRIMNLGHRERQLGIAAQILRHKVFHDTFKLYLQRGNIPDRETIVQIMKGSQLYHVEADQTYFRRASTVVGWVKWMAGLMQMPE